MEDLMEDAVELMETNAGDLFTTNVDGATLHEGMEWLMIGEDWMPSSPAHSCVETLDDEEAISKEKTGCEKGNVQSVSKSVFAEV